MTDEDVEKYVLDVKNTLISNLWYPFALFLGAVFIFKGFAFLGTLETEDTKLLGLIVFSFATMKLLTWIPMPTFEYKPRNKEVEKETGQ